MCIVHEQLYAYSTHRNEPLAPIHLPIDDHVVENLEYIMNVFKCVKIKFVKICIELFINIYMYSTSVCIYIYISTFFIKKKISSRDFQVLSNVWL